MDEIWKLVYDSFEQGPAGAFKTVTASNSMRNEVQFRLSRSIGEYKSNPSVDLMNSIEADVQAANSLNYMSDEITKKILELIDTIRGENHGN